MENLPRNENLQAIEELQKVPTSDENFELIEEFKEKDEFWWDSYEDMECEEIRQFDSCLEELRKNMVAEIASDGDMMSPVSLKQNLKEYMLVEQFVYQEKDAASRGLGFKDGHFHTESDKGN